MTYCSGREEEEECTRSHFLEQLIHTMYVLSYPDMSCSSISTVAPHLYSKVHLLISDIKPINHILLSLLHHIYTCHNIILLPLSARILRI